MVSIQIGGDEGDRTPGLGIANAALSQLSYIPNQDIDKYSLLKTAYTYPTARVAVKKLFISPITINDRHDM
jgi:hypothetical protein